MDIQLKRGMLDVCVLAAIKDEDSYGYQIIKDMKPYVTISESTLYPILRRLEANAYLTVQSVDITDDFGNIIILQTQDGRESMSFRRNGRNWNPSIGLSFGKNL